MVPTVIWDRACLSSPLFQLFGSQPATVRSQIAREAFRTYLAQEARLQYRLGRVALTSVRVSTMSVAAVAGYTGRTDIVNTMLQICVQRRKPTPPPTLLLLYNPKRGEMP